MTAFIGPTRACIASALIAGACSTYEPGLVDTASSRIDSSGFGGGGTAGSAGQAAVAEPGSGGDLAGSSATAGSSTEAGQPSVDTVPYVTGVIAAPSISVGLTLEGTLDWAHWGLKSASDYNHKANVVSQLLDFKPSGALTPERFLAGPTTFAWTDGTPTQAGSTNDGILWRGKGEGFQLVVPAGVDVRWLRLYVGVFAATGVIKASLSDPRANAGLNDRFSSDKEAWVLQVITVEYGNADAPSTTLDVSWSVETAKLPSAAVSLTALSIGRH